MDAVEYVKQCRRMIANDVQIRSVLGGWSSEAVVEQVKQWAKKHPVKTRQSEFLKQWPNARLSANGILSVCPMDIMGREYVSKNIPGCINSGIRCDQCKRDFWLKEIE